ncbi:hypothetical protein IVB38_31385 [Bradyrhizobium sp. 38]|uniref:hypothetical protein n=1 Tax=unclassified Bradyrhizobium TaxID=2631580 RepID=UPI001FF80B71|nr:MULTISPECIES: hypothetical protein [unclassified Bradyrhizobium]MCK1340384.1 hypothetical protein [Bradyrhizobium sp. 38]MCK1781267.1 hypothetical protein [Bradyrhizobium sp. 132]
MRWFEGALFEFGLALLLGSGSHHLRKKAEKRRQVQSTLALMKTVASWELTNEAWE